MRGGERNVGEEVEKVQKEPGERERERNVEEKR